MRAAGRSGTQTKSTRALGVATWLLLLALVPLCGAGVFVVSELDAVTDDRDRAQDIDSSVHHLVLLNEFRGALLDERNWASATAGIDDLGVDDAVIRDILGVSVVQRRDEARVQIDVLLDQLTDASLTAAVDDIRSAVSVDFISLGNAYSALDRQVADLVQARVDQLLVTAGQIGGGSGLIDVLRILESASLARQSLTSQVTEYFALEFFGVGGIKNDATELLAQHENYQLAMGQIARVESADSRVATARTTIVASPEVQAFRDAVDRLLSAIGQSDDGPAVPPSTPKSIEDLAAVFLDGVESSNQHLELVDAAADDVTAVSADLIDGANSALRSVVARIIVVTIISLACAFLLSRIIGRPLRDLAVAARNLRDGDTGASLRPAGPAEVREAARAISEAAGHLELAERQAKALAQGEFDHPVLAQTAPGSLGASLQDAVQTLAASLSDREEFRRMLAHEATHDALTQLSNRRAVMARLTESLARTRRNGSNLAVMFLDLDDFKVVNDRHGHLMGDAVLRTVSQRLLLAVRKGDHVGRLGGDEFLVVAEPVTGFREALGLAERLLESVQLPIAHGDAMLAISASVGIALVDDRTVLNAEEVLRDADLAVYQAKTKGRARIELCDEDLRTELERRTRLEDAIRTALDEGQLRLHYQPIIDPGTGGTLALEALVRWEHPQDGLVGPDAFIPFAERSDLILEIDRWVAAEAARQLDVWTGDPDLGQVAIAINISGRHLGAAGFHESILTPLTQRGVRPDRLIVEVTESALLDDMDTAARKLHDLRAVGVRVAIDDFGTGYTSLSHLRNLPIDILKIDRSFTSDPNAASLVKLIIDTGHLLGATITAEGVETVEQATMLTRMGADELQGYLYAQPTSPTQLIEHWAHRHRERAPRAV